MGVYSRKKVDGNIPNSQQSETITASLAFLFYLCPHTHTHTHNWKKKEQLFYISLVRTVAILVLNYEFSFPL